jgi:hypothetical protein
MPTRRSTKSHAGFQISDPKAKSQTASRDGAYARISRTAAS